MLEIKDLHVHFHDADHEAVRGISLTVADGEIMGLVGESGSGKTVTAMVVSGLMPRRKADVSGQVLLDGKDLLALDAAQMRRRQGCAISVVFQEPMSAMNPVMRIGPQMEEALRVHTNSRLRSGGSGPCRRCGTWIFLTPRQSMTSTPTRCPAVCCSGP